MQVLFGENVCKMKELDPIGDMHQAHPLDQPMHDVQDSIDVVTYYVQDSINILICNVQDSINIVIHDIQNSTIHCNT